MIVIQYNYILSMVSEVKTQLEPIIPWGRGIERGTCVLAVETRTLDNAEETIFNIFRGVDVRRPRVSLLPHNTLRVCIGPSQNTLKKLIQKDYKE